MVDFLEGEEKGAVGKLFSGDWHSINKMDAASLAGGLANFIPGVGGGIASAGIAALEGTFGGKTAREKLEAVLEMDLDEASIRSRAARTARDEIDARSGHNVASSVLGTTGALAGAKLGTLVFPGLGTIAGGIVGMGSAVLGSLGAQKAYDVATGSTSDGTLSLIAKLRLSQMSDESQAPATAVFAAIAGGVNPVARKGIEKRLEKLTRGRVSNLAEAVAADETEALTTLMHEYDDLIRTQTGLIDVDDKQGKKNASEIFAELINQKKLDARVLMFNDDQLAALEAVLTGDRLAASGVQPASDGEMQSLPPTAGGRKSRGAA